MSIRKAVLKDKDLVMQIVREINMFSPDELEFMDHMFNGFCSGEMDEGHNWIVIEDEQGNIVGTSYHGPEAFVQDVLNIYFIAVSPLKHGSGYGRKMMDYIESAVSGAMRIILVETSSQDKYAQARQFYTALGYDEEARIRDYYGPNDNKITYWKKL